ncbi:MAG: Zn-ribbon domain-containing OB-fold protein [Ignavibacteria bacterium]|nr:Zn-ribbon domain-containing OB-fold protein [Ignavibacteria bacterium]
MISPRYAREIPQRYQLVAARCTSCGTIGFPPRRVCKHCRGRQFEPTKLDSDGKILTFTIIRVGADRFSKQTPYAVAVIELNDGTRLTAQVTDCELESLEIGQKVRLVFRKIQEDGKAGILCYGYKAICV